MTPTRMRQLGLAAAGVGLIGAAAWLLHTRLTGGSSPSMVPNPDWFTGTGAGGGGGGGYSLTPPAEPVSAKPVNLGLTPWGNEPPTVWDPPPTGIPAGAPGSYVKTA